MCKRLLVCFVVLLLAGTTSFAVGVGIFDEVTDVGWAGDPKGIGCVHQEAGNDVYRITGGGSDVWNDNDHMVYAYKALSGDWLMAADFQWICGQGWWGKGGVMLRESTATNSMYYGTMHTNTSVGHNSTVSQWREGTGWGTGGTWDGAHPAAARLGIQRFNMGVANLSVIESIADFGSGWELIGTKYTTSLPDTVLYGAFLMNGDNNSMGQARASNVAYDNQPHMLTQIPNIDNPGGNCMQTPGFKIYTVKKADGNWGSGDDGAYQAMNDLLDGKLPKGIGRTDFDEETGEFIDIYEESRLSPFVNLHDSDWNGNFGNDESYPCVDVLEQPTSNPANGDNDDNFATDASACIQLTAGYHIIGVCSDDGAIIKIGGVEIGRTGAWKGADNQNFLFNVLTAGLYSFNARNLEGGGGASFELYEILANGTMVLLGDVANGGSPVYVPEPATIALLGLGGMSLLGIRRKR